MDRMVATRLPPSSSSSPLLLAVGPLLRREVDLDELLVAIVDRIAASLHADRTQAQRTQAVEGFRSGTYKVLVATDVAARGLDIDGITHVVNYEVPSSREMYVHRVGRTGRAEMTGTALTLVAPEELRALQALQRSFGMELQG